MILRNFRDNTPLRGKQSDPAILISGILGPLMHSLDSLICTCCTLVLVLLLLMILLRLLQLLMLVLISPLEIIVKLTQLLSGLLEQACQAIIVLSSFIICGDWKQVRFRHNGLRGPLFLP